MLLRSALRALGPAGEVVAELLFSLMLVAGLLAVAGTRTLFSALSVAATLTLAAVWLGRLVTPDAAESLRGAGGVAYCALLTAAVARRTFSDGPVDRTRIEGAVVVYLLIGLAFASAYRWLEAVAPGAFRFGDPELAADPGAALLYFSFVTLTTVGYGDVTPLHPIARSLAPVESLVGQLFPAVLLARLVALEVQSRSAR